jgi:hypothetical protein
MKKSFHLILLCFVAGIFFSASAQKVKDSKPTVDSHTYTYIAPVITPDDSINVYPQNENYWTGTCNQTNKTQVSLVNAIEYEVGWMVFDVSGIPPGATINSITFNGYVYDNNWPYWSITPMGTLNPVSGTAADIFNQINANYGSCIAYSFNPARGNLALGWCVRTLGTTAPIDLQNALAQGWFAIGIAEWDFSTSFYIEFQGWQESYKPYLVVDYTLPPTIHDVGTQSIDIPGVVDTGVVIPKATVFSKSTTPETFDVTMTITQGGYSSTKTVTNLLPGGTQQVTFDNWNATYGSCIVEACTQLVSDQDSTNNCMSKMVYCWTQHRILYEQMANPGPNSLTSQNFEASFDI